MTDLNLEELKQAAEEAQPFMLHGGGMEPACVSISAGQVLALIARIENLEAAIQRVRDVHKPVAHNFLAKYCQCGQTIPCRTIKALEGDPK